MSDLCIGCGEEKGTSLPVFGSAAGGRLNCLRECIGHHVTLVFHFGLGYTLENIHINKTKLMFGSVFTCRNGYLTLLEERPVNQKW